MSLSLPRIQPGRYIVAVSGGVDSIVLLDALHRQQPWLELVVAHLDHGIRKDSAEDATFVGEVAKSLGLEYAPSRTKLGAGVSEAIARKVRYRFLQRVKAQYNAQAIITAHHADDVLETTIINMVRGTGWRGLSSLRSNDDTVRPMLGIPKNMIVMYAQSRQLAWREDSTNADVRYLRNHVRLQLLPRIAARDASAADDLLRLSNSQGQLRIELDRQIKELLNSLALCAEGELHLKRLDIVRLPSVVCLELLRAVAVQMTGDALERTSLRRMRVFACTARPSKRMEITKNLTMRVLGDSVIVYNR